VPCARAAGTAGHPVALAAAAHHGAFHGGPFSSGGNRYVTDALSRSLPLALSFFLALTASCSFFLSLSRFLLAVTKISLLVGV
jgi:hypothetical protein